MKNGYTTKEMLAVMIILGVFTIGILGTTSYAYKDRTPIYYEQVKDVIEMAAVDYGKTLDSLKKEGNLVITVDDLVKNGFYVADMEDGLVSDPRNSKNTLNGMKIKLSIDDKEAVKAKLIED